MGDTIVYQKYWILSKILKLLLLLEPHQYRLIRFIAEIVDTIDIIHQYQVSVMLDLHGMMWPLSNTNKRLLLLGAIFRKNFVLWKYWLYSFTLHITWILPVIVGQLVPLFALHFYCCCFHNTWSYYPCCIPYSLIIFINSKSYLEAIWLVIFKTI